jgi:hypothetical protein
MSPRRLKLLALLLAALLLAAGGLQAADGSVLNPTPHAIGALARTENLKDLQSASAARTNLGLGSAALEPTSAFDAAGAAQTERERAEAVESLKAPLASPLLTGTPQAPTAAAKTSTEQLATTAFVQAAKSEAETASLPTFTHTITSSTGNISLASTLGGSGTDNTSVGYGGNLESATTGAANTTIGWRALKADTTGAENVADGKEALAANTEGSKNVAAGFSALKANTTGGSNIALGPFALAANTEGSKNVALGAKALASVTTGTRNLALGVEAGTGLTTGKENTVLGEVALQRDETGERNVAVGIEALGGNKGSRNTAIGHGSLVENLEGSKNTALGTESCGGSDEGKGEAVGKGEENLCLGYFAGYGTKGHGNVYIGCESGKGAPNENNNRLTIGNLCKEGGTTPLLEGNFGTKIATINGRLEPGEATSTYPTKPAEGAESTANEISTLRKRTCAIVGNGSKKSFKCEDKLGTRLKWVVIQKATSETEAGEVEPSANYKTIITGTNLTEVNITTAPSAGAELFVTVIG